MNWSKTPWARRVKNTCISCVYKEALEIINSDKKLSIYYNNDNGEWVHAVTTADGFWLDAFSTRDEAREFLKFIKDNRK